MSDINKLYNYLHDFDCMLFSGDVMILSYFFFGGEGGIAVTLF